MKNKDTLSPAQKNFDKNIVPGKKAKSLRPMRSLVAVRSFKPKTAVAAMTVARPAPEEN